MKSGWERYATKERYVKKGYLRKYSDGSSGRKANEASRSNSLQQSRESQEEAVVPEEFLGRVVLITEDVVFVGEENDILGRRSQDSQQEGGDGVVLALPDVPKKRVKRRRKETDS